MLRDCETKKSDNGEREMREKANVEDGERKSERTAEGNMIADGAMKLVGIVEAE